MPKTKTSRRTLPLPDVVVQGLRAHRAAQVQKRLAAPAWADEALVFTTGLGTPLEPRNVLRSFHELCDRAEIRRVRIHDLRHARVHPPARARAARRGGPDGRPAAPGRALARTLITPWLELWLYEA
jgi:integrase